MDAPAVPPAQSVDAPAAAIRRRVVSPPLKWAGGKRWQLNHLRPLWAGHGHRRLVEPFCGGLAVCTGLMPERALLNDVNPHLINFYNWLKRGLIVPGEMRNDSEHFYRSRDRFNALSQTGGQESAEAAGLFYYLNRTGFNGLCRFNGSGLFNVPFGRYASISYRRDFRPYRDALAFWTFTAADFAATPLEDDDFVYADPPYDVEFTQYSKGGFGWEEQVRTAEWLACHKGPVILANQATPRIVRLYRALDFSLTFIDGPRRIACTGDRTPAREILAFRNLHV